MVRKLELLNFTAGSRFMAGETPRVLDRFRFVLIAVDGRTKHAG
jgi:hypothetical protein